MLLQAKTKLQELRDADKKRQKDKRLRDQEEALLEN